MILLRFRRLFLPALFAHLALLLLIHNRFFFLFLIILIFLVARILRIFSWLSWLCFALIFLLFLVFFLLLIFFIIFGFFLLLLFFIFHFSFLTSLHTLLNRVFCRNAYRLGATSWPLLSLLRLLWFFLHFLLILLFRWHC